MRPITDSAQIEKYRQLAREMMSGLQGQEYEFNPEWVLRSGWKVVPVESAARLPIEDIPRITAVLKDHGGQDCVAVVTEPGYLDRLSSSNALLGDVATCFIVSASEQEFRRFNQELGPFRSLLMPENRSWAISCNEVFNLFGAEPHLLEALLGKAIEDALQEFEDFAVVMSHGDARDPLLRIAREYKAT